MRNDKTLEQAVSDTVAYIKRAEAERLDENLRMNHSQIAEIVREEFTLFARPEEDYQTTIERVGRSIIEETDLTRW